MADDVAVVDDAAEGPEARRARRETPQRSMTEAPTVTIEAADDTGPTPEEALAAAQKALATKDAAIASERQRAVSAETAAAQARDAAARERAGRVTDRAAAVASAAETAAADKQTAITALKMARDAGDFDAEIKAIELLNSATYRQNQTAGEIASMKMVEPGAGTGGDAAPRQTQGAISPAAQSWIDAHPRFNSDGEYKKIALAAHGQAILDGAPADSQAYFRYLNAAVADLERREADNGGNMDRNNGNGGRRASSEAAPPGRGNGGHGGAARTVQTKLGPLNVSRRADGKLGIQIPPNLRADFEEGAKITNMSLGEYALEQVRIADEIAAGGNGGLVTEEGSIYR